MHRKVKSNFSNSKNRTKMSRILISIILVATLFSCTKNSYTLRGTAESTDLNGVVVSIQVFDGETWNSLGEVPIENQQFIFKGIATEPTIALLSFNDPAQGTTRTKSFVLENATINFNITGEEIIMQGSKANNLLQTFENELQNAIPQAFLDSIQNNLLSESELSARVEHFTKKRYRIIADFVKKNVNTLHGTFIFQNFHRHLSSETKIAVLNLMNEITKEDSQIQHVAKQMEAELKVAAGQPYIDFALPTPNGEMLSLSDVVGNHDYVLLHFWASWCGPCIRIFPEMTRFYREHAGESFEIFSVSLDNDANAWKNAIETHGLIWSHHVSDLKVWDCEVRQLYAVNSIPTRILIDRNGNIVGRNMSFEEIAELLR